MILTLKSFLKMNEKALYTAVIEDYLDGDLSGKQKTDFEAALKTNERLAFEFQLEKEISNALLDADILDFRAKLNDAQDEFKKENSPATRVVHILKRNWAAAAAVIVLLVVAGTIFLANPGGYSNEQLFNMYYKSGESVGITRSGNANMVEALMSYHQGDFQKASQLFQELLENDPYNMALKYYNGIANMETENYSLSISEFQDIIADNNNLYIEYAQWYLGLAYLVRGDEEEAKAEFGNIAGNESHYYNEEAKSILEKLEKKENSGKIFKKMLFFVLPF